MNIVSRILEAVGIRPKPKQLPKWQNRWLRMHAEKSITRVSQVERALVRAAKRGGELNQAIEWVLADLQKAFTPVTNSETLAHQGRRPYRALYSAISSAAIRATLGRKVLDTPLDELLEGEEAWRYAGLARMLQAMKYDDLERRLRTRYVYSFVRRDMSPEQRLVQTGHALYEAGHELALRNGEAKPWQAGVEHTNLVCVDVADEAELIQAFGKLQKRVPLVPFYEEDASMTAFASLPVRLSGRELFRGYDKLQLPHEPNYEPNVWRISLGDNVKISKEEFDKVVANAQEQVEREKTMTPAEITQGLYD